MEIAVSAQAIFLNGTSSSGKTTLARALQAVLPESWQHLALDQFRDGLPDKFRGLNAPEGTTGWQGLNVVPVTSSQPPYTRIAYGDQGLRLLKGMRRAMRSLVDAGNNIIIDDIILEPEFLNDYLDVFAGIDLWFVGIRCDLAIIEEREAQRLGRFPGTARGHFMQCHAHDRYDIQVDTGSLSPQQCAAVIQSRLAEGAPQAFIELRRLQSTDL